MIFVTVGTHEQPFDRLVSCVDALVESGRIKEEVVIQIGFSNYEPQHCRWSKLLPHKDVRTLVQDAHIVITHGGPASFMMPLLEGKVPIVVPRQSRFDEHVNDHQAIFCREVAERQKNIILVEDLSKLAEVIDHYDETVRGMLTGTKSNNEQFNKRFCEIVDELFAERK